MADFTDGEAFLSYLSSAWSQIFTDCTALARGLSYVNAFYLQQLYQDFLESVNRLGISTIPVFHRELVKPLVLRSGSPSNNPINYGEGEVYGPQPPNSPFGAGTIFAYGSQQEGSLYYLTLPGDVIGTGRSIVNRLLNASAVLSRGADWSFENGVISFAQNPFNNPLIPQRTVATEDGGTEQEIVLWLVDVDLERFNVYEQFGFAYTPKTASSEFYKLAIQMVMQMNSAGPTPQVLDSLVAAIAQVPLTSEANETVVKIDSFQDSQLVITDASVYKIPAGLQIRSSVVPGAILEAGTPLTTATQVLERVGTPNWWSQFPAFTVGQDFTVAPVSYLGFINDGVQVVPGPEIQATNNTAGMGASFYLAGSSADVTAFWNYVNQQSAAQGLFLGDILWEQAGLLTEQGTPDFTQDLYINPLNFFSQMMADGLVVITIQGTLFTNGIPLFRNLALLRSLLPVWISVVVFIELNFSECFQFESTASDGVQILTAKPVSTVDLLKGNVDGFDPTTQGYFTAIGSNGCFKTPVPEALSIDDTPDTIAETLDFSDPNALGTGVPVCEEQVWTNAIETCN